MGWRKRQPHKKENTGLIIYHHPPHAVFHLAKRMLAHWERRVNGFALPSGPLTRRSQWAYSASSEVKNCIRRWLLIRIQIIQVHKTVKKFNSFYFIPKEEKNMEMTTARSILTANGIDVAQTKVNKNGVYKPALVIGAGSIKPTVYEENLVNIHNEEEMLQFAQALRQQTPAYDMNAIFTKEYFMTHVKSCLRPVIDDDDTLTFPVMGDLQEYFRVYVNSFCDDAIASIVVQQEHIKDLGIDADEFRSVARKNLKADVEIMPMSKVLASMMGDLPEIHEVDEMMYVASNRDRCNGAAVMLLDDVLDGFCCEHSLDSMFIIPSSIHEVLFIVKDIDPHEIDIMIGEVNQSTVSEMDRLSDHVYHYHRRA